MIHLIMEAATRRPALSSSNKYSTWTLEKLAAKYDKHPKHRDFWLYEPHIKKLIASKVTPTADRVWQARIAGTKITGKMPASSEDIINFLIAYHQSGAKDAADSSSNAAAIKKIQDTLDKLSKEKQAIRKRQNGDTFGSERDENRWAKITIDLEPELRRKLKMLVS